MFSGRCSKNFDDLGSILVVFLVIRGGFSLIFDDLGWSLDFKSRKKLQRNLLSNERDESFWDALWLELGYFCVLL